MVGSWGRGRVMATGIRPDTMAANRAGLKYICFNAGFPESEFLKIDAYTQNIKAEESPYLVNGQLSESALRGKELFEGEANCAACHSSASFGADVLIYENFTMSQTETRGLLVPPLVEVWRTAPYLHDGSAATILDVITTRNLTGTHGNVSDLSASQLQDLCNYVLSLGGSVAGDGNGDVGGGEEDSTEEDTAVSTESTDTIATETGEGSTETAGNGCESESVGGNTESTEQNTTDGNGVESNDTDTETDTESENVETKPETAATPAEKGGCGSCGGSVSAVLFILISAIGASAFAFTNNKKRK